MIDSWKALFASRKFWIGTLTIIAIVAAVLLVSLGKIESASLVPTIVSITTTGVAVIGTIAWEDTAQARVTAAKTNSESVQSAVGAVLGFVHAKSDAFEPSSPIPPAKEKDKS